jgi:allantoate deiminase
MHDVHRDLSAWMTRVGLVPRVDAAGNLRGLRASAGANAPRLFIGSHLDTVPGAGAFDGILGVVWAIALMESIKGEVLPFEIEVLGFSDEEGVRFGVPFIGSRALAGTADEALLGRQDADGIRLRDAIIAFGLDPVELGDACATSNALGYLECHIEQGPVLEHLNLSLGVVTTIVGQTRADVHFAGSAGHAGTTPMRLRRDAMVGAAEWIQAVERTALETPGLVATTGRIDARPDATNVIAGDCDVSLDLRHADNATRHTATDRLCRSAQEIATRRGLTMTWQVRLDQPSVAMDPSLTDELEQAAGACGVPVHRMPSGAGHDAMVMAPLMPAAILFIRSPGGISHHPDEDVRENDVATALAVGRACLLGLARASRG